MHQFLHAACVDKKISCCFALVNYLVRILTMKTADLVDQFNDAIEVAQTIGLKHYSNQKNFSGIIQTLKCLDDNSILKKMVSNPGHGDILVVDGNGSMLCALMGDVIAGIAQKNGWTAVIINGCIRDSVAIENLTLGVMALGTNPKRSAKENKGAVNEIIHFAGINFTPGYFLYADEDGLLVSPKALF